MWLDTSPRRRRVQVFFRGYALTGASGSYRATRSFSAPGSASEITLLPSNNLGPSQSSCIDPSGFLSRGGSAGRGVRRRGEIRQGRTVDRLLSQCGALLQVLKYSPEGLKTMGLRDHSRSVARPSWPKRT